jgi:Domain of unknown function (DUF4279)
MPSKAPCIRTEFWIEGDELDPDVFTYLVGVKPSKIGRKGEVSANPMAAKRGVQIPQTFWCIEVEHTSYSMDEGIQVLLTRIWPSREKVLDYIKTRPSVTVGMNSTIHIGEDRPVYEISLDSIKKLAELECRFMLNDIYPLE